MKSLSPRQPWAALVTSGAKCQVQAVPAGPAGLDTRLIIRDDFGFAWTFDGQRIRMIDDLTPDGGYACNSWEEAIRFLNETCYITPGGAGAVRK